MITGNSRNLLNQIAEISFKSIREFIFYLKKVYNAKLYFKLDCKLLPCSALVEWGDNFYCLIATTKQGNKLMIFADKEKKEMYIKPFLKRLCISPECFKVPNISHNEILDLTHNGDRWEGDVVDGWPMGFGYLYNENDRLVYSGFMYKMHKVCYGTSYYEDLGEMMVKYEGMYMWDERFGRGSMYDRNGRLDYEGEWINNHPRIYQVANIFSSMDLETVNSFTEEVIIADNCCNGQGWEELDFRLFPSLISLVIGSNCFAYTTRVILSDLLHLREFTVGRQSFTFPVRSIFENHFGSLEISSCPELTEIRIGCYSFVHYDEFHIQDLPKLVLLSVGDNAIRSFSFKNCDHFLLCDLPSLEVITIGGFCWLNVSSVHIESMYRNE